MKKRVVVALGHRALGTTLPEQKEAVKKTAKVIGDLIEKGYQVAITHSNAPQVGMIHTAMNEFAKEHEDYTAEGSHTDIVDTTMRDVNPLTAPIRDLINQYSKMSLADREKNHIYLETDGNYTALWTKRHNPPIKTYQLNPSHDKSIYPGITSTDFQFSNTNESWRVWDSVYKITAVYSF